MNDEVETNHQLCTPADEAVPVSCDGENNPPPLALLPDGDNGPPVPPPIQQQDQLALGDEEEVEVHESALCLAEEDCDRAPIPIQLQEQQLDDAKRKAKAEISTANERGSTTELVAEEREENLRPIAARSRVGASGEVEEEEVPSMPTPRQRSSRPSLCLADCDNGPPVPIQQQVQLLTLDDKAAKMKKKQEAKEGEQKSVMSFVEEGPDHAPIPIQQQEQQFDDAKGKVNAEISTVINGASEEMEEGEFNHRLSIGSRVGASLEEVEEARVEILLPTPHNDAADAHLAPEEMPAYVGIVVPSERTRLQTWVEHIRDNYKSILGLTILVISCAAIIVGIVFGGRRNKSSAAPSKPPSLSIGSSVPSGPNDNVVPAPNEARPSSPSPPPESTSENVPASSVLTWNSILKLLAPDGAAEDRFGRSVAIYEDTIVVGVDNGAHVFARSGDVWAHQAKLLAPDGEAGDKFGDSVAIHGDTIVVGAHDYYKSGSAHVFVRSREGWTHQAKLLASEGAEHVAIYGDTIVIGSDGDSKGLGSIFVRIIETWTRQATLLPPDGEAYDVFGDSFGRSFAIYEDMIVAGYFLYGSYDSGSAYVFVRSDEVWEYQVKLQAPIGASIDDFGDSVAIFGDTIVIGAHGVDDNGSESGSAHVFVRIGEEWTHQAKLLAPDGAAGDCYGKSVAIYGDTIVIGSHGVDDNGSGSGSAHVFVQSGEVWTHQAKIFAPEGADDDRFEMSVAIYGYTVVVGADWDDDNNSGSARVFDVGRIGPDGQLFPSLSSLSNNPTASNIPTKNPTIPPSENPTLRPTNYPSSSVSPTNNPTASIIPTTMPTLPPTDNPTLRPTNYPSSSASPSCGSLMMMIQIQYDSYPSETSYKLEKIASEDGQETELTSHSGSTGDKNHEESICLDDGLYSFSFYDSYGDGFNGEYSLTLVPGEAIIMRDSSESQYGEQVLFRIPFDRATLDVRWIGSDGQLLPTLPPSSSPTLTLSPSSSSKPSSSVSPSNNPTASNIPTKIPTSLPSEYPTLQPTNYPSSSASPSCGGSLMMIQIRYDSFPMETSYKLGKIASEDGQETELASHRGSRGDKNHEESICLDDGLYSFSFYDSYGDGFNGEYSLTLVPGEAIIMRDSSESRYGEQILFRLPFDRAMLDVRWIGSDGQLLTLAPTNNPTDSNKPTTSNTPTKTGPTPFTFTFEP